MTKRGIIAAHHPASSILGMKRDRLERARQNHRAFMAGVEVVHNGWYNPERTKTARIAMNRNLIPLLRTLASCIKHHDPTDPETLTIPIAARGKTIQAINSYNITPMEDDTDQLTTLLVNEPDGDKYVNALRESCVLACNAAEAALDYNHDLYLQLHDTLNELLELLAPEPDEFERFQKQLEINMSWIDLMPPEPEPKKPRTKPPATVESLLKEQKARRRQL